MGHGFFNLRAICRPRRTRRARKRPHGSRLFFVSCAGRLPAERDGKEKKKIRDRSVPRASLGRARSVRGEAQIPFGRTRPAAADPPLRAVDGSFRTDLGMHDGRIAIRSVLPSVGRRVVPRFHVVRGFSCEKKITEISANPKCAKTNTRIYEFENIDFIFRR